MTFKYYATARPFSLGTHPKRGVIDINNFDERTYIDSVSREVWGVITYDRELSALEIDMYELIKDAKL